MSVLIWGYWPMSRPQIRKENVPANQSIEVADAHGSLASQSCIWGAIEDSYCRRTVIIKFGRTRHYEAMPTMYPPPPNPYRATPDLGGGGYGDPVTMPPPPPGRYPSPLNRLYLIPRAGCILPRAGLSRMYPPPEQNYTHE